MEFVRPGVNPEWIKEWEKQRKLNLRSLKANVSSNIEELDYYAREGVTLQKPTYTAVSTAPPSKDWERFLPASLKMYGNFRALELQEEGVLLSRWDSNLGARSFASIYTGEMITIMGHSLFSQRFEGRVLQMMDMKMLPYTALGLLTGATEQALTLAKLQANAYRRGFYLTKSHYPIFTFILRIFADYLGEPTLAVEGESLNEPILNLLFERWREPNPTMLTAACVAACDFHTSRCGPTKREQFHEFDNGSWMRIPIEILLMFKLRKFIGLENPQFEHPLMNTVFGTLPPEVGFQPDDLVARVRTRMQKDGFDENSICSLGMGSLTTSS